MCFGNDDSVVKKFAWGSLGGSIGGMYIFLKAAITLVGIGGDVFSQFATYLILLGAAATAGGGVLVLNAGLKRHDAMFIAPMYQSWLVIMGALSGAVFFEELKSLSLGDTILFIVSMLVMLFGICCCMLATRPDSQKRPAILLDDSDSDSNNAML